MVKLKNDRMEAAIAERGAELQRLRHINGVEYMWCGDDRWWGKHSPVLFPIVGSLLNNTYYFEGKSYTLPRHGFARDRNFVATRISDAEVVFSLESDADSLLVYPFGFRLSLGYRLEGDELFCAYKVENIGDGVMYFSVGGHPAFALPLDPGLGYHDYFLQFEFDEPLVRYKLQDGLISKVTESIPTQSGKLMLSPALFYEDAIVLKHLKSTCVTLAADAGGHGLRFKFENFPYLGIWAAKDAPFICIEPWCGHADNVGHNQQLIEKEGIERLAAGQSWQRTWSVACF